MLEFRYDTQLLIEGKDLSEDAINDYFMSHFAGDCLLAVGDEELIKIHFHTNEPWKVLEYCASLGGEMFIYSTRKDNAASKALAVSCGFLYRCSGKRVDLRNGEPYELEIYCRELS